MRLALKNSPIYLLIAALLVAIAIVLSLIRAEMQLSFPPLAKGAYIGTIDDVFDSSVPIYIYSEGTPGELIVSVLERGWSRASFSVDSSSVPPLEVRGPTGRLKFVGARRSDGTYSGEVFNLDLQSRGSWKLDRLEAVAPKVVPSNSLTERVSLQNQIFELRSNIESIGQDMDVHDQAISEMRTLLEDDQALDTKIRSRMTSVRESLLQQEKEVLDLRQRARELAKELVFSEKLTDAGKLVSLSRKTLHRERRWIESAFRDSAAQNRSFYVDEYERAERVIELLKKIKALKLELGMFEATSSTAIFSPQSENR